MANSNEDDCKQKAFKLSSATNKKLKFLSLVKEKTETETVELLIAESFENLNKKNELALVEKIFFTGDA